MLLSRKVATRLSLTTKNKLQYDNKLLQQACSKSVASQWSFACSNTTWYRHVRVNLLQVCSNLRFCVYTLQESESNACVMPVLSPLICFLVKTKKSLWVTLKMTWSSWELLKMNCTTIHCLLEGNKIMSHFKTSSTSSKSSTSYLNNMIT
jgi:hypothetical protein